MIEPLEALDLAEGQEITVVILEHADGVGMLNALKSSAGAWTNLVDGEELKKDICESRLTDLRPEPKL